MYDVRWANILPDKNHWVEEKSSSWMHRILHDDGITPYTIQEQIHVPLLPWIEGQEDIPLEDLRIIHFGMYNENWVFTKYCFYQMVDIKQQRTKSLISIFRYYNDECDSCLQHDIPKEWLYPDVDIFDLLDTTSLPIFCQYIKDMIAEDGIEMYARLDIWKPRLLDMLQIKAPKQGAWELLYAYLRRTQKYHDNILVRGIDKVLKFIV